MCVFSSIQDVIVCNSTHSDIADADYVILRSLRITYVYFSQKDAYGKRHTCGAISPIISSGESNLPKESLWENQMDPLFWCPFWLDPKGTKNSRRKELE